MITIQSLRTWKGNKWGSIFISSHHLSIPQHLNFSVFITWHIIIFTYVLAVSPYCCFLKLPYPVSPYPCRRIRLAVSVLRSCYLKEWTRTNWNLVKLEKEGKWRRSPPKGKIKTETRLWVVDFIGFKCETWNHEDWRALGNSVLQQVNITKLRTTWNKL